LDGVWRYEPSSDEWTEVAPLPAPRNASDAVGVPDGGIVIGGQSPDQGLAYDNVWHYVAALDTWVDLTPFPAIGRRGAVIAFVPPNRVYYGTGSDNSERHDDWWKLEFPVSIPTMDAPEFTMSPVPADAALEVSSSVDHWTNWQVWSIDSRLVAQGPLVSGSVTITMAPLPAGAYMLRLVGIHGSAAKRFTVAH